jgi:hypothetical protein
MSPAITKRIEEEACPADAAVDRSRTAMPVVTFGRATSCSQQCRRVKRNSGSISCQTVTRRRLAAALAAFRRRLSLLFDNASHAHAAEGGPRYAETDPTVDTLVPLYGSAPFMERECHDMYGIVFRGNGDLRPILLYEGFKRPTRCARILEARRAAAGSLIASDEKRVNRPFDAASESRPPRIRARRARRCGDRQHRSSHPATHGTIQVIAMLDGEKVERVDVHLRLPPSRLREGVRGPHLAQPDPRTSTASTTARASSTTSRTARPSRR